MEASVSPLRLLSEHGTTMASEEAKKFNEMMELIQDSFRSFNEFKDEGRKIVLQTRSFADDIIEYTTDAQDDELGLQDKNELLEDLRNSKQKMEECIKKADTVKDLFKAFFEKLKKAQRKAVDGQLCGMENMWGSVKKAIIVRAGASAVASVTASTLTAATGGLVLPFLLTSAALMSFFESGKHMAWDVRFATVERKLDRFKMQTDLMKNDLIDLHHESGEILEKASRIAHRAEHSRSRRFKLQCRRLGEQSAGLKKGCNRYLSHDDDFEKDEPISQLAQLSIDN